MRKRGVRKICGVCFEELGGRGVVWLLVFFDRFRVYDVTVGFVVVLKIGI